MTIDIKMYFHKSHPTKKGTKMVQENGPGKILKMAQGFMESRILLSTAELNLFRLLSKTPLSAKQIGDKIKGRLYGYEK